MVFNGTFHQNLDLTSAYYANLTFSGIFLGNLSAPISCTFSGLTVYGNLYEMGQSNWGGVTVYGNLTSNCQNSWPDDISSCTIYGDASMTNSAGQNNSFSGGIYYGSVTTDNTCLISGGTYYGSASSGTNISGGDFYGSVAWGSPNYQYFIPGGFLSGTVHNIVPTVSNGKTTTTFGGITLISASVPQLDVLSLGLG